MGAVISFFKMVGMFIFAIPQNIICIFKLAFVGAVKLFLLIPGVDVTAVALMNGYWFLLQVWRKLWSFWVLASVGGALALVDKVVSDVLRLEVPLGNHIRTAAIVLSSCDNDPRAWYRTPQWHLRNRFERLLGVSLCMAPCSSGYAPKYGGLICGRRPGALPRRCPHAYVTLAAEPFDHKNTGASSLNAITDRPADAAELREYRGKCDEVSLSRTQRRLPEALCWQAEAGSPQFASSDIAGMCYEMMCSRDNPDSAGQVRPSFCASLVPPPPAPPSASLLLLRLPGILFVMLASLVAARLQMQAKQNALAENAMLLGAI